MVRKDTTILGIDRGSKYIGIAYAPTNNDIIFPVGYLMNDQMIYFHIADMIKRYGVKTIVLGRPSKQKDIQQKISKFMNSLNYIIEKDEITIETVEEDYSSVES
jgi:RNase H-fold protein (predicted Holliday junction resolvase)